MENCAEKAAAGKNHLQILYVRRVHVMEYEVKENVQREVERTS